MPLQTTFGTKVTKVETTQRQPLGTIRYEGSKIYEYVKAGGTITAASACSRSAAGTVVLQAASIKPCGWNATGSALSSGDYFWMQKHGEVTGLNTNTATAVGYGVGVADADGTTLADAGTSDYTTLGNSTFAVKDASAGVIYLSGLA